MAKLFLLKPDFTDPNRDNEGELYYCPECAEFEGVLQYYPQLKEQIEIHHIGFSKPRNELIELIGEENQSCPVLIIDQSEAGETDISYFKTFGNKRFVNTIELIANYLTDRYKSGIRH